MASDEVSSDLLGLYDAATKWTLANDASLFAYLEDLSKKFVGRTECTSKILRTTWEDCEKNRIRLQSCVNAFNMLSNVQFMESRVRDEDYETSKKPITSVETPSDETPENKRLRELREAVSLTQNVLRDAFDIVEINLDDSDEEEDKGATKTKRTFREPKDPYLRRPLPYLIGSADFHRDRFIGLKLQADEPEALPEEDLILTNKLDDVLVAPPSDRPRTQTELSFSSTSSDIPQTSADNFRNPGGKAPNPLLPPVSRKATAVITSDSDEDENDLFATRSIIPAKGKVPPVTPSPTLDHFRTSPPRTRTSSQASSKSSTVPSIPKQNSSIFDDEDEESDLFSKQKSRSSTIKPAPKPAESPKVNKPTVVARVKPPPPKVSSLFDDDEEDQDDLFSVRGKNKIATPTTKSRTDSTSSVPEQQPVQKPALSVGPSTPLMSELAKKIGASAPAVVAPPVAAPVSKPAVIERKEAAIVAPPAAASTKPPKKSNLFEDNSDEDDLFTLPGKSAPKLAPRGGLDSPLSSKSASPLLEKKQPVSQSIEPTSGTQRSNQKLPSAVEKSNVPVEANKPVASVAISNGLEKKKPTGIFDDDDSDEQEDLFSTKPRQSQPPVPASRVAAEIPVAKNVVEPILPKKKVAASIFDDDDENDDLFAIKKPVKTTVANVATVTNVAVAKSGQPVTEKDDVNVSVAKLGHSGQSVTEENHDVNVVSNESEKSLKSAEKWKLPGLTVPAKKEEKVVEKENLLTGNKKKSLLFEDDDDEEDLFAKKTEPKKRAESLVDKTQVSSSAVADQTNFLPASVESNDTKNVVDSEGLSTKEDVDGEDTFNERPIERSGSAEFGLPQLEPPPKTAPPRMHSGPPKWKLPGLSEATTLSTDATVLSNEATALSATNTSSVGEVSATTSDKKPEVKNVPAPAPRVRRSATKSPVVEAEVTATPAPSVVDPAPRSLPSSRSSSFSSLNKPPTIFEDHEENLAPPTPKEPKIIPVIPEMSLDTEQKVEPPVKRPVPARRTPAAKPTSIPIKSDLSDLNDEFRVRKVTETVEQPVVPPATLPVAPPIVSAPVELKVRTESAGLLPPPSLDSKETDDFQNNFGSDTPLSMVDHSATVDQPEVKPKSFEPAQEPKSKGQVESRSRAGSVKPVQASFKTPSPDLNDEFDEPETTKKNSKNQNEALNSSPVATRRTPAVPAPVELTNRKIPAVPVELGVISKPSSTAATVSEVKNEDLSTDSNLPATNEKELSHVTKVVVVEEEEKKAVAPLLVEESKLKSEPAPLVVRIPVFSLPDTMESLSQVPEPPPLSFSSSLSSSQGSLKKRAGSMFEDEDSDEDLFGSSSKNKSESAKTKQKNSKKNPAASKTSTVKVVGVSQSGIFDMRRTFVADPLNSDANVIEDDVTPKNSEESENSKTFVESGNSKNSEESGSSNSKNSTKNPSVFDIGGSVAPRKASIFENDDEDEDDMFGPPPVPAMTTNQTQSAKQKSGMINKKKPALFDDEDDDADDLFKK